MNIKRRGFVLIGLLALVAELFMFGQRSPVAKKGNVLGAVSGSQWYVSPNGNINGDGSINKPWDLQTALCGGPHTSGCGGSTQPTIHPGDTVWLQNGTYGNGGQQSFFSTLSGTQSQPIYFRQLPGSRATVNGSLEVDGNYVWFWGFEIENSAWYRLVASCGSFGNNVADGIHFKQGSVGSKMINLVIHDVSNGIADQQEASETEDYGNLIYNTGWDNTTNNGNDCRGHGHSLYMQNNSAVAKVVEDNIAFNSFAENIQGFGSQPAISHLHFIGNTAFNAGMNRDRTANMTLGGGSQPHEDILFDGNVIYQALDTPRENTGYNDMEPSWNAQQGKDLTMKNNFWVGATPSIYGTLYLKNWQTVSFQNNTVVGALAYAQGTIGSFNGSGNRYFNSRPPAGTNDASPVVNSNPTGLDVVIRPNKYDIGRANITVLNWDKKASVPVDLSKAGIPEGTNYEIYDAQNFWGPAIYSGTYHASNPFISLPMSGVGAPVSTLLGIPAPGLSVPSAIVHTSQELGAFILLPKGLMSSQPPVVVIPPVVAPTPINAKPIGYIDGTRQDGTVFGWAKDPDDSSRPVQVHVYIDSNAGSPGAVPVAVLTALDNRSDVGNHAFNFSLPAIYRDGKQHQIWIWAIDLTDTSGSSNIQLPGSPVSWTYSTPPVTPPAPSVPSAVYVPIPNLSPVAGYYNNSVTVTMSDSLSGAVIYYTTDGSTPTQSSSVYSGPITVTKSMVIKAAAYLGDVYSGVISYSYGIISNAAPVVVPVTPPVVTPPVATPAPVPVTPSTPVVSNSGLSASGKWSLDSDPITDSSRNNITGTLSGHAGFVSGRVGQALNLDGINSYASFGNNASLADLTSSLTLVAWIRTSSSGRSEAIISKYDATAQEAGYIFKITSLGKLGIRFGGNSIAGSNREFIDTGRSVNDGQWHQVIVVINLGQNIQFYIDGVLSSSQAATTISTSIGLPLEFGGSTWPPYGNYFTGLIDEVSIYRQALSAQDIAQLYNH